MDRDSLRERQFAHRSTAQADDEDAGEGKEGKAAIKVNQWLCGTFGEIAPYCRERGSTISHLLLSGSLQFTVAKYLAK